MNALTMREVAEELRISYSMVRKLIATKGLPYVPIGKRKIVRRQDLDRWLKERVRIN